MLPFRIAAADLIIGAACAGCGRPAITLCDECAPSFIPEPREAWPRPAPAELLGPKPVRPYASAPYEGPVRSALACYKEQGQFGLLRILGHMLAASVCAVAPADSPLVLVPIPSARLASVRRGYDAIGELARTAGEALRAIGLDCRVAAELRQSRRVADQSGLGARERSANMADALTIRSAAPLRGRDVIVVDDIITTGASIAEAVRVLDVAGCRPFGVAVVAVTERHAGRHPGTSDVAMEKRPPGGYGR